MQIKLDFIKKYVKHIQRVVKAILNCDLKIMTLHLGYKYSSPKNFKYNFSFQYLIN